MIHCEPCTELNNKFPSKPEVSADAVTATKTVSDAGGGKSGEHPMWGRTPGRNMVNPDETGIASSWPALEPVPTSSWRPPGAAGF